MTNETANASKVWALHHDVEYETGDLLSLHASEALAVAAAREAMRLARCRFWGDPYHETTPDGGGFWEDHGVSWTVLPFEVSKMNDNDPTYTNTALATARRCLTEYDLGYLQRLTPDAEDSEALQVGQAWHKAFDDMHKADDELEGYASLGRHAPGPLWRVKLARLFAAYQWYWSDERLQLLETERTFRTEFRGITFEGQIDGIIRLPDGRRGVLERKTAGSDIGTGSSYWDRLLMDIQTGLYSLALDFVPSFILYDVVRKPTINPKAITKADMKRLRAELDTKGSATYFEEIGPEDVEEALLLGRETPALYGARLTSDIGDDPGKYFARREVPRTRADFATLIDNLEQQVGILEHAKAENLLHRNPDSCNAFGRCRFFGLCSNNIRPRGEVPEGFHRREHEHPELA